MAKKTFYSFEKRQKEIKKQQKKEAKAEARRQRKENKRTGDADGDDDIELGDGDLAEDAADERDEEAAGDEVPSREGD